MDSRSTRRLALAASLALVMAGGLAAASDLGSPAALKFDLPSPSLHQWLPVPAVSDYSYVWDLPKGFSHWAISLEHDSEVYGRFKKAPWLLGHVRQGQRIPVYLLANGYGCKGGDWYRGDSRATICSTAGFNITTRPPASADITQARLNRPLPYRYRRLVKGGARLEFNGLPTPAQAEEIRRALASGEELPEIVEQRAEGAFFTAVDRVVSTETGRYLRTIRQTYVRAEETAPVPTPGMHGEPLTHQIKLPLAFAHLESGAKLFCRGASGLEVCGKARQQARFQVTGLEQVGDQAYVHGAGGFLARRQDVRVAIKRRRPPRVAAEERWVHFDLRDQVMVAYEGDRPVYATLISSGKEGYETPTGLFHVYTKWISHRMVGTDEKDGPYDIDEVPWVMFYRNSYAVHGAYWHNTYGQVRSHGCTNLSPADARWLFHWTANPVPRGWHGLNVGKGKGTAFFFTK